LFRVVIVYKETPDIIGSLVFQDYLLHSVNEFVCLCKGIYLGAGKTGSCTTIDPKRREAHQIVLPEAPQQARNTQLASPGLGNKQRISQLVIPFDNFCEMRYIYVRR